jgi:pimeloyl-ACP methyl ester carboxylesterase
MPRRETGQAPPVSPTSLRVPHQPVFARLASLTLSRCLGHGSMGLSPVRRQRGLFCPFGRGLSVRGTMSRRGRRPHRKGRVTHEALVDGVRIAYSVAGAGSPLVLLHGGMDDSRSWRRQREGLADEFRVLAWDAPGCGQSSEPPETWRMPDYADCLAAWLAVVGVEQPHVLGLSWGSSVALELYRRHPQVPASLILASAYAGWAGSLSPEEVDARLESVLAAADLPPEELLQGWPGLLTSAASAEVVDELVSIWAANAGTVHPAGYRAMAHSMAEADLRDVMPRIEIPTLLLYGELDQRSTLQVASELQAHIPTAKLVVLPGVGHISTAEAPDAFNACVREFLRSLDR